MLAGYPRVVRQSKQNAPFQVSDPSTCYLPSVEFGAFPLHVPSCRVFPVCTPAGLPVVVHTAWLPALQQMFFSVQAPGWIFIP